MLFNSYEFILAFLPTVWLAYYFLGRSIGPNAGISVLVLGSLFFYGWWYPPYLLIILASILVNFRIGRAISAMPAGSRGKRAALVTGIVFNLGLLAYYKYTNFLVGNVAAWLQLDLADPGILLPIGISFYTFQQITFLADSYQESTEHYTFLHYCLYISFFPQLIAGPIVHHKTMMPQFMSAERGRINSTDFSHGLFLFSLGLFKKVIIADNLALFANPVFAFADAGGTPSMLEGLAGTFAYGLQLYFDFSGYSDMAIGLALFFGIRLPINFNSPYKAVSIVDFWRRWHITLSEFLRDYLYIPLGGNRKGRARRYINLLATMLLGGIWHGAGWGFALWGLLHGLYLIANHLYRFVRGRLFPQAGAPGRAGRVFGWALTFAAVMIAWIPFRATTLDGALNLFSALGGRQGLGLPPLALVWAGIDAGSTAGAWLGGDFVIGVAEWARTGAPLVALALVSAVLSPNSLEIAGFASREGVSFRPLMLRLQLRPAWAVVTAALFLVCMDSMNQVSEFMYFQF